MNTYIVGETINGKVMMPPKRKRTQRFKTLLVEQNEPHISDQHSAPDSNTALAPASSTLPSRSAPALPLVSALHIREPAQVSTIFHQGSVAINPLGAYTHPVPYARKRPQGVTTTSPPEKRRRVVSGSFGTFEGTPERFDEGPFRLLPGQPAHELGREKREVGTERAGESKRWLKSHWSVGCGRGLPSFERGVYRSAC